MNADTATDIAGIAATGAMIVITKDRGQMYVAITLGCIGTGRADTIDEAFRIAKTEFRHELSAAYHLSRSRVTA